MKIPICCLSSIYVQNLSQYVWMKRRVNSELLTAFQHLSRNPTSQVQLVQEIFSLTVKQFHSILKTYHSTTESATK